jgi:hypothetical protein
MQLIINRDAGTVTINGTTHIIDLASVQPEIASVRWLDDHGEVYFRDGSVTGLGDVMRFKPVIDAWHAVQNAMRMR